MKMGYLTVLVLIAAVLFAACAGEVSGAPPATEPTHSASPPARNEAPASSKGGASPEASAPESEAPASPDGEASASETPAPAESAGQTAPNAAPAPSAPSAPLSTPAEGNSGTPPESVAAVCSLAVRCSTILENLQRLDPDKAELVPADGALFLGENIEFSDGETVFDLLKRVLREKKIHLEFSETPGTGAVYIEGISNLYEFDCGELSGWLYLVNGASPGISCSAYKLSPGDKVEWLYTCDLGKDLGVEVTALQ